MSKKKDTIPNEVLKELDVTSEQAEEAMKQLNAVNMDEVTNEVIAVKIREYRLEDVVDDDGNVITDDDGNPRKTRKVFTRTAHINNFVPLPVYQEFMKAQDEINDADIARKADIATDLVLKIWQNTEEWMTRKKLGEGLDLPVITTLFTRFFNKSRL